MTLLSGVDASFDALSPADANALKAAGVSVFAQCLWDGGKQPGNRVINLRNAINGGLIPIGYISVTGSHNGVWHVEQGRAGVPDDIWDALVLVPIDVELDGIPNGVIREAVDETVRLSKRPCIYTSYNAWKNKQHEPLGFTDCLLWNALWDENPDIDFPGLPYGGWQAHQVVGEQWAGGDNYVGVFVDRDTFAKELLLPQEETPIMAQTADEIAVEIIDTLQHLTAEPLKFNRVLRAIAAAQKAVVLVAQATAEFAKTT